MNLVEVQVDRLVGPTHHFGGLGVGNLASQANSGSKSNPKAAALQGLDKIRRVAELGVVQLVLPPHPSPDFGFLAAHGFGTDQGHAARRGSDEAPELLSAATSCAAMWTANAATVSPAADGGHRNRTQVSIANLNASLHRSSEPTQTAADLRAALGDTCEIHDALPGGSAMRDEGAANHMRLGSAVDRPGVNVFVYGDLDPLPQKFWPRQTLAAFQSIARRHRLHRDNTFFLKQHPRAIDAGAFHNDVVAMSHRNLMIHHEFAFEFAFECDSGDLSEIAQRYRELEGEELKHIVVPETQLSLHDAVRTYLFNSQIVSPPDSRPVVICPQQVREHSGARSVVRDWVQQGLFREAIYVPLDQSMSAGGGPACLRLRVPLAEKDLGKLALAHRWTPDLDQRLRGAIQSEYPDQWSLRDIANQEQAERIRRARAAIETVFSG